MPFCEVSAQSIAFLWCTHQILLGYSWEELPKGSLVIDVGGGFGNVTKVISKAFPDLKYIVQDRAASIEEATKVSIYCSCP